jgi:ABC-type multidrug transport system fused ATPase/permease subunit
MQARVRSEVFAAFTGASWAEQSRDREGHLQELVTNQATQAGTSAGQAAGLVVVGLTFIVLVISALLLNVIAALAVLVTASALFALLRPLSNLGNRRARALSNAFVSYAGGVNEAVRLAEETHVFGAVAAQRERNDAAIVDVRTSWFHAAILIALVPGIYQSLIFLLMLAALAGLYALGTAPLASLGAVVLLLVRAGNYGQQVQSTFQALGQSLPYVERLQGAQRRYAESTPAADGQHLEEVRSVAFDAVNFEYERGRPVLFDIRFEVLAGETVGIVGPSGAGKSTVAEILLGLRAAASGQYLVNDTPADRFRREDWHRRFSYLPQEPRLLHASVAENIRFFRDIDRAAVEHAARLAGIHDEVIDWSRGYDTVIGPRADAISGGQQQRICLARALAARPEILVLDEPTSALDPHAESLIKESLATLRGQLTLFVIAHRLSTLDVCDRVMVIVGGRLEAFGAIPELQASSGYFRSAWAVARSASAVAPIEA